jgi:hypothetical protein
VIALITQSPHLNQTEIAARIGISRQRVAQIVSEERLAVPRGKRGAAPRRRVAETPRARERSPGGLPAYLAEAGGAAAVLITAADLMARGFAVYLPIAPTAAADILAIDANGRVKRVAVRPARRTVGGAVEYSYPKPGEVDTHATLLADTPIQYSPEL